jgi:hypothetical protein
LKFKLTIKLLDYASRRETLEKQDNPFAIVILAHLTALKTRKNENQRFLSKLSLARALYQRGLSKDYILNLLLFIDWVLVLPEPFEIEYAHCVEDLEKEKHMAYISSFERMYTQRGVQEGIQKGEAVIILRMIQNRFGDIPQTYEQRIHQANTDTLLSLADKILKAQSLVELFEESEIN